MTEIADKVATLWPEIVLLIGAVLCLFTGLSPWPVVRKLTALVAATAILFAAFLVPEFGTPQNHPLALGPMVGYLKTGVLLVGLVLLLVAARAPDQLKQVLRAESQAEFDPGEDIRGEFFAFFLFSLTGVLMSVGATDLVWLFLALELTSLPTYILVATGRDRRIAQESAVKYFFLGAMAAATFLYGFALIYVATGFTDFAGIRAAIVAQPALSPMLLLGMVLAIVGIGFKIAAVPMHFYTADVYQGAAVPVTTMLAFVPKTAGFAALILLLSLVGWDYGPSGGELPPVIGMIIGIMAVLTMTVGNVLGLLQNNVKRTLAYSSVAHSGYMLVGLLAGPLAAQGEGSYLGSGLSAVLFYLMAYGLGTIASFAVLGCLHGPEGDEADTYDDLSGLRQRHPFLAGTLLLACLSLLGFPFTVGLLGKMYLIGAGFQAGYAVIAVIMVVNSAISAAYYLRIGSVCFFGEDRGTTEATYVPVRITGAIIAAVLSVGLGVQGGWLVERAHQAGLPPIESFEASAEPSTAQPSPQAHDAIRAVPSEPSAWPDTELAAGVIAQ